LEDLDAPILAAESLRKRLDLMAVETQVERIPRQVRDGLEELPRELVVVLVEAVSLETRLEAFDFLLQKTTSRSLWTCTVEWHSGYIPAGANGYTHQVVLEAQCTGRA
jgi:hypothetical protein